MVILRDAEVDCCPQTHKHRCVMLNGLVSRGIHRKVTPEPSDRRALIPLSQFLNLINRSYLLLPAATTKLLNYRKSK